MKTLLSVLQIVFLLVVVVSFGALTNAWAALLFGGVVGFVTTVQAERKTKVG